MLNITKIIRRAIITVLFLAALFSTFRSISGVDAEDLAVWMNSQQNTDSGGIIQSLENSAYRGIALTLKTLPFFTSTAATISSAETNKPKTLEEAVDFSKYPSMTVTATGYTAGEESTGKDKTDPDYGITKSGVKVKRDLFSTITADTSVFPIGTILYIPGYGYGVVADTGSAIQGTKIDLYYETVKDVFEKWGKKTLSIYVVKRGTGKLSEKELVDLNEDKTMQVFRQEIQ